MTRKDRVSADSGRGERLPQRSAGPRPNADERRRLSRSTLWDDNDRGEGTSSGPQPLRARWDPVPPPRPQISRRRVRKARRRSSLGWFIHHYGWRAYALPVLAALTVAAVVGIVNSSGADTPGPDTTGSAGSLVTITVGESVLTTVTISGPGATTTVDPGTSPEPTGGGAEPDATDAPDAPDEPDATGAPDVSALADAHVGTSLPSVPDIDADKAFEGVVMGVLPPGPAFAKTGAGTFHVVPGASDRWGSGSKHVTFTVEVEDGIQPAADDAEFADSVVAILSGPSSWINDGKFTLQRVDSGDPNFRISLTSQMTARSSDYCGWDVQLEASCYNQQAGRAIINNARWIRGAYSYGDDLTSYRVYAINHEVGHALGHHHEACPSNGDPAPVMMQQSWSTSDDDLAALNSGDTVSADGNVCVSNPFVYPDR